MTSKMSGSFLPGNTKGSAGEQTCVHTNTKQMPPVVINLLHLHPIPPLLCSPASFPSFFLHLHPLFSPLSLLLAFPR